MPEFMTMMQSDWLAMLQREGTVGAVTAAAMPGKDSDDELPCPACGTAAPLVDGCCSDCGLHLD